MSIRNSSSKVRVGKDGLPEWFDVTRYDGASELTLAAWLDNLDGRYDLLSLSDKRLAELQNWLDATFSTGDTLAITWGPYAEGEIEASYHLYYDDSEFASLETPTVHPVYVSFVARWVADAIQGEGSLSRQLWGLAEKLNEAEARPMEEDEIIDDESQEFLDQPFDTAQREDFAKQREELFANDALSESSPIFAKIRELLGGPASDDSLRIEVDLGAPDKLIIEDFRNWLKAARRVYSIEMKNYFTESMRSDWAEFGVLPYLDLSIWARANSVNITDAVMGDALFPNEVGEIDLEERMRKVVRPKANWLMTPTIIQAIETQVLRPG